MTSQQKKNPFGWKHGQIKLVCNRLFFFIPNWDTSVFVFFFPWNVKTRGLFSYRSFVTRIQQAKVGNLEVRGKLFGKENGERQEVWQRAPSSGWRRDGYVSASSASVKPRASASSGVKPLLRVRLTAGTDVTGFQTGCRFFYWMVWSAWAIMKTRLKELRNLIFQTPSTFFLSSVSLICWNLHDLRLALDLLLSRGWVLVPGPWVADLTIRSMISSAASSPQVWASSTGGVLACMLRPGDIFLDVRLRFLSWCFNIEPPRSPPRPGRDLMRVRRPGTPLTSLSQPPRLVLSTAFMFSCSAASSEWLRPWGCSFSWLPLGALLLKLEPCRPPWRGQWYIFFGQKICSTKERCMWSSEACICGN